MSGMLSEENERNFKAGYDLLSREGVTHSHFYELPEETKVALSAKQREMIDVVKAPKGLTCGLHVLLRCRLAFPEHKITLAGYDGAKSGHLWDERAMNSLPPDKVVRHNFKGEYDWLLEQEAKGELTILRNQ